MTADVTSSLDARVYGDRVASKTAPRKGRPPSGAQDSPAVTDVGAVLTGAEGRDPSYAAVAAARAENVVTSAAPKATPRTPQEAGDNPRGADFGRGPRPAANDPVTSAAANPPHAVTQVGPQDRPHLSTPGIRHGWWQSFTRWLRSLL